MYKKLKIIQSKKIANKITFFISLYADIVVSSKLLSGADIQDASDAILKTNLTTYLKIFQKNYCLQS